MKTLILLIFSLLITISTSYGGEFGENEIIYRVQGKLISFKRHKTKKYLISFHCDLEKNNCIAQDFLVRQKKVKLKNDELVGGKNPGSVVCRKLKETAVVFGKDLNGNQQSFCRFSDESLLSSGILGDLIE